MEKFNLWLMMIPPAWLGGTITIIYTWIEPHFSHDPVGVIVGVLLSLIGLFVPFMATYYVVKHIEEEFWKLERRFDNEEELLDRVQVLKDKREREEIEITRLTALLGSREAAIHELFRRKKNGL
jgi:hypothetical protein